MKLFKKLAAAGLSVVIAGSLLAGCGSPVDTAQIDGTKTVVTINEDEVPLGTLSFLAKYQQAQMYAMYTASFGGMFGVRNYPTGTVFVYNGERGTRQMIANLKRFTSELARTAQSGYNEQ